MSDTENTVILPEDDEDNKSITSKASTASTSVSKQKRECPHCQKEITVQNLFRHIKSKHDKEFNYYMTVWKVDELQQMISKCNGFPVEYTTTNDFDETVENKFYGCLACGNTFTQQHRATAHCKDKKCKAVHIAEFKHIVKQEQQEQKQKKKQAPTRPLSEIKRDIVMEQRRYKYILKMCTELNSILEKLIQKLPDSKMEQGKRITNLSTFPQECYSIPPDMDGDKLSAHLRMWGGRVDKIETAFRNLREYLYFFSYSSVDHMYPESDTRPHGKFIAANYHDTLGPDAYPSIDTLDETLVAPVVPTTQTTE